MKKNWENHKKLKGYSINYYLNHHAEQLYFSYQSIIILYNNHIPGYAEKNFTKIIEKQIGSIIKKNKTQKTHQDIVFCVSYLGTFTRSNLKLFPFELNRPNYLRKKSCPLLELLTNSIYSRSSGATDDKNVWSETDTALLMHANTELA